MYCIWSVPVLYEGQTYEVPDWARHHYSVIQCCLAQRVLPDTVKSRTDHTHLEARETS
jgi:hypothetical protein